MNTTCGISPPQTCTASTSGSIAIAITCCTSTYIAFVAMSIPLARLVDLSEGPTGPIAAVAPFLYQVPTELWFTSLACGIALIYLTTQCKRKPMGPHPPGCMSRCARRRADGPAAPMHHVGVQDVQYLLEEQKRSLLAAIRYPGGANADDLQNMAKQVSQLRDTLQAELMGATTKIMEQKAAMSVLDKTLMQQTSMLEKKIDAVYAKLTAVERMALMLKDGQAELRDGQIEIRKEQAVNHQKTVTSVESVEKLTDKAHSSARIAADQIAHLTGLRDAVSEFKNVPGALQAIEAVVETLPNTSYVHGHMDHIGDKIDDCHAAVMAKTLEVEKIGQDIGIIVVRFEKEQARISQEISDKISHNQQLPVRRPPGHGTQSPSSQSGAPANMVDLSQALSHLLTAAQAPPAPAPGGNAMGIRPIQLAQHVPPAQVAPPTRWPRRSF